MVPSNARGNYAFYMAVGTVVNECLYLLNLPVPGQNVICVGAWGIVIIPDCHG